MTGVGNKFSHAGFLSMKAHRLFFRLVMERFGLLVGRASSRAGRAQLASTTNLASGVMRSSLSPRRGEGLRVRGEAPLTPRQSDSTRRFTPHPGPLPSEGRGRTSRYVLVVLSRARCPNRRRPKAALKTHALQTLRDCRSSTNRAQRLECGGFSTAFRPLGPVRSILATRP